MLAFACAAVLVVVRRRQSTLEPSPGWVLEEAADGARHCTLGRRPAAEHECFAAVKEAAKQQGLEVAGFKTVNHGADGEVPPGCSYSLLSQRAMFNRNPSGTNRGAYQLACIKVPILTDTPEPQNSSKPADEKRLPVVLGVTETACAVREHNEQLLQDLTSACEGYPELVVILNIFDSEDDSLPRSLNCGASAPSTRLPPCVKKVTHVPGMKGAFWRYAVGPREVAEIAPRAEIVWLFDNDLRVSSERFDLREATFSLLGSNVSLAQPRVGWDSRYRAAIRRRVKAASSPQPVPAPPEPGPAALLAPTAAPTPAASAAPIASPASVKAATTAPTAARCVRVADVDYDRWFLNRSPPRQATEVDCSFACNSEDSEHHSWCVGHEFTANTRGAGTRNSSSTCKLYADCSPTESTEAEGSALGGQETPARKRRLAQASGEQYDFLSAERPMQPPDCRVQAAPFVEVQTPMLRIDSYLALHKEVLSTLDMRIFNHTDWGIDHVWCSLLEKRFPDRQACAVLSTTVATNADGFSTIAATGREDVTRGRTGQEACRWISTTFPELWPFKGWPRCDPSRFDDGRGLLQSVCLARAAAASSAYTGGGPAALCITGQSSRLELTTKVHHVLKPMRKAFGSAHAFLVLEEGAYEFTSRLNPSVEAQGCDKEPTRQEIERELGEHLKELKLVHPTKRTLTRRLWPNYRREIGNDHVWRKVVHGHLSQFEHLHECMTLIEDYEARAFIRYSYILSVRDCTHVFSPIDPGAWPLIWLSHDSTGHEVSGVVVKSCDSWNGTNDKAMLLRRSELRALGAAFETYVAVEAGEKIREKMLNTEQLLQVALHRAGVSVVLNDGVFPMTDGRCNGTPRGAPVSSIKKTWCHVQREKDCVPPESEWKMPISACPADVEADLAYQRHADAFIAMPTT